MADKDATLRELIELAEDHVICIARLWFQDQQSGNFHSGSRSLMTRREAELYAAVARMNGLIDAAESIDAQPA